MDAVQRHTPGTVSGLSLGQRVAMALASFLAMLLSAYLLNHWVHGGSLAGCSPGSSCDSLSASVWGNVLGLPVSALGISIYLVLLGTLRHLASMQSPNRRRVACFWLAMVSTTLFTAAVWFVILQLILSQFCWLCLTIHGVGLLLALAIIRWIRRGPVVGQGDLTPLLTKPAKRLAYGLGILLTLMMAAVQLLLPVEKTYRAQMLGGVADIDQVQQDGQRVISVLNGRVRLSVSRLPRLGRVDAPHVAVLLMDYTCEHCRQLHHDLRQVYEKRGGAAGDMAILFLPTPPHPPTPPTPTPPLTSTAAATSQPSPPLTPPSDSDDATALAQLALALWKADALAFDAFDQALTAGQPSMSYQQALTLAAELVGSQTLEHAMADPWPQEQAQRHQMLYRLLKTQRMPVLILGSMLVTGRPATQQELDKLIAEHWPVAASQPSQTLQFSP